MWTCMSHKSCQMGGQIAVNAIWQCPMMYMRQGTDDMIVTHTHTQTQFASISASRYFVVDIPAWLFKL